MKQKVSVIIPCRNERERIVPVIDAVKASKIATEIIVVDNASEDESKKVLAAISGIKLIENKNNIGKSSSMKKGVLAAKYPIIIFVDADLVGLKPVHLINLVTPIIEGTADLVISDRQHETWHSRLSGFSVAYTGERAVPKSLLLKHLSIFDQPGYLVEPAINQEFIGRYRVHKVLFSGVAQFPKFKKGNFWPGLLKDIKMLSLIIGYLGLFGFLRQLWWAKKLAQV